MAERGESEGMSPLFHMFPKYHRYKAVRGAREGAAPEESRCVCVARVPQDRGEGDLFTLFEQHAGRSRPERVRLVRDRATGASQSLAFVDFHSRRDASSALERLQSLDSHLGGERLSVQLAPDDGIDASAPQHAYDWACDDPSCAAINFAKRSECHRCAQRRPFKPQLLENASAFKSDKPAGALKVGTPSSGVMVCGLEPHVDERTLTLAITPIAPVKDLRLVRQKHSLQSRCFAFCDLFSTSDATNVLNTLNGAQIESQETPLRILFTRDGQQAGRYQEDKNHPDDDAAAAANETEELKEQDTEQPRHALDAWEPAAFSEANIQTSIEKELNATAEAAQASHAERTEPLDGLQRRVERYQELQTESEVEQLRAQQHEEPNKRATSFVWDAQSNTYFEQNSGYYYEPWRQLWYEPWNAIWYYHDTHRQVLVPCQQQTADNQTSNGQQQAQAQQPSELHQQEPEYSSQDRPQACSQRHAHATSVTSVRLSAHLPDFVKSLHKCRHNIIELSYRRSASERLRVQASARKGRIWVQALAKRNLSCTRSALTSIGQSLDSLRLVRYEAERGESNISNSESLDAVSLLNEKPVFGRSFIDEAPYGSKCNFLRLKSRDSLSAWTEINELWSKHSSSSSRLFCG